MKTLNGSSPILVGLAAAALTTPLVAGAAAPHFDAATARIEAMSLVAPPSTEIYEIARRGRGADDGPGDDRGGKRGGKGRGGDDAPNHG